VAPDTISEVRNRATYKTIRVDPIVPAIGAEITGVDVSAALNASQFQEIHDALMTHQVIFFRDQDLSKDALAAFARRFGELHVNHDTSFGKLDAHPEIEVLDYDASRPPYVTKEMWHSDFSGREEPTLGAVLYALEVPACGGDTLWVSMYAAYEALSDGMKQYLSGMRAEHSTLKSFGDAIRSNLWQGEEGRERFEKLKARGPVEHPVIRTHPVTRRKALYVNEGYTTRLIGADREKSDDVLSYLFEHVRKPEFQCRFRWRKGSLAVWDNRVTQHYAVADYAERRLMHRIAIKGDRPY
jgi:taurine dioxygenase